MHKYCQMVTAMLCAIFEIIAVLSIPVNAVDEIKPKTAPAKTTSVTIKPTIFDEEEKITIPTRPIKDESLYPLAQDEAGLFIRAITDKPEQPIQQIEEEPLYSLTQEEIDLIALVTMAEVEGETELAKRLVIDTILNRMDDEHFPDTVHDVVYQPSQFSVMWNGRIERCYVMPEIVDLVKEELIERTNYDCVFFTAGGYGKYGEPMFQECCCYFSSYD